MKKTYSPLAALLLIAFMFVQQVNVEAQRKVRGNGHVVTEEHKVGSFSELFLDGVCNIYIDQGSEEKVVVEADENLHEYIYVDHSGDRLEIDMKSRINIRTRKKLNIYVTVKDINRLRIMGVGNVRTEGTLKLDDLKMKVTGVGNVKLDIEANSLDAEINSVGNITLAGEIDEAEISNRGVGKLDAYDMRLNKLDLNVSGVGKTEVYVEKEIAVRSTGVGNVHVRGDAVITELHSSGVGKVKKM